MQFTNPASISTILRLLAGHEFHIPVLADTVVRTGESQRRDVSPLFRESDTLEDIRVARFVVERQWKAGIRGVRFPVLGLQGRLEAVEPYKTEVTVGITLYGMGYIVIVLMVVAGLLTTDPSYGITALAILVLLIVLILIDLFVLWRVLQTLRGN